MMFALNGKTALVTGSSRGIGRAIAVKLAEAGADVIVCGRSESDALKNTAKMVSDIGRRAYIETADTSNPDEISRMFERVERGIGSIDILVNNAAVLTRTPFLDLPVVEWDKLMNTNARGYFLCAQNAARLMVKQGKGGRIINISSISQFEAAPGRTHYCASKGAIGMLTKGMALELAPYNITANAVLPGSISTDFNSDVLSDKGYYNNCIEGIPLKRIGVPGDVAGAVVMLASEEASYISGAEIVIDGAKTVY